MAMQRKSRRGKCALTAIDLFAGCGGLSVGLSRAGFRVLGAIDIDELAMDAYEANHAGVRTWRTDITQLPPSVVMAELGLKPGGLDLLAGCPPCQGFSSIRTLNRSAIADARNDLIFAFLDYVRALKPRAVMMENVPGLASDTRMTSFVQSLEDLGYVVNYDVLDASEYGVPQRRRRVILLAGLYGRITFGRRAKRAVTVADAIGDLPLPADSSDPLHNISERRSDEIKLLIEMIPLDGGSRTELPAEHQLPCHLRVDGFHDVYGRMSWNDVAPTITGGCVNPSKGRFLHPEQHRAITLREAALLQTFPKRYKLPLAHGKYRAAQMIGNALPPEFIRRHAGAVRRYLEEHGPR